MVIHDSELLQCALYKAVFEDHSETVGGESTSRVVIGNLCMTM